MVGIGIRLGLEKVSGGLYEKILGTERSNLIGYWPMDEASGTNADNAEGTAARDGTYTGVTLNQGVSPFTCPLFDGVNDYCDIDTASLVSAVDPNKGTMLIFANPASAAWSGEGVQWLYDLTFINVANVATLWRSNGGGVTAQYKQGANNVQEVCSPTSVGWNQFALTWDTTADEMKLYLNGAQAGSTQTGLVAPVGSLTLATIGARNVVPESPWDGYIAHAALWKKALTAAQILAIYQASGVA